MQVDNVSWWNVLASFFFFFNYQRYVQCFEDHLMVFLKIHLHSHQASDLCTSEDVVQYWSEMSSPFSVNQNLKLAPGSRHFVWGRMITGNEGLDFSREFASSLLWQVNVVLLTALCGHPIFFSAEKKGITSTCILRNLSLCLGFILLLLLGGSRGVGEIFLHVFLFVFITLHVLQFFSYLNFEFAVSCFWCKIDVRLMSWVLCSL